MGRSDSGALIGNTSESEQLKPKELSEQNDFMFELSQEEFENLKSQYATSSWGGRRTPPQVFTEQGVAMLSGVLHSERAIEVNIQIMRVFTRMREMLETNKKILKKLDDLEKRDIEHDENIMLIFEYIRHLEQVKQQELEQQNRKQVGFKRKEEQ
jgi:hypothetical protein